MEKNSEPRSERRQRKRRNSSFERQNSQTVLSRSNEFLTTNRTALFAAVRSNETAVIKNKINNDPQLLTVIEPESNNTLLHIALEKPVALYTLTKLIALFKRHTNLEPFLKQQNASGRTPLMHAVHCGNLGAARKLLQEGVSYEQNDIQGRNCLHIAVIKQDELFVDEILQATKTSQQNNTNARVAPSQSLLISKDIKGRTPLSLAVNYDNLAIIEKLICAESINEPDTDKQWSPLHWAAYLSKKKAITLLLKKGASNIQDSTGQYPIHLVAGSVSPDALKCLKKLLAKFKETEVFDNDQKTPLMLTAMSLNLTNFKFLKDKKANLLVQDKKEKTILHYLASSQGSVDFIDYFLKQKIVKRNNILETADKSGRTPLFDALGNQINLELLTDIYHADITIVDNKRFSLLHVACQLNRPDALEFILKRAQKIIDWPNDDGDTPLIIATQLNYSDCIKKLIAYGANPQKKDIQGWSAVGWAASNKELDSLRILAPNLGQLPQGEIENAREIAEKSNNQDILLYLQTYRSDPLASSSQEEKKSHGQSSESEEKKENILNFL